MESWNKNEEENYPHRSTDQKGTLVIGSSKTVNTLQIGTVKENIKRFCLRMNGNLHREMKTFVASKEISIQDYICKLIEEDLQKNRCAKIS
jgi:hypothetical protein